MPNLFVATTVIVLLPSFNVISSSHSPKKSNDTELPFTVTVGRPSFLSSTLPSITIVSFSLLAGQFVIVKVGAFTPNSTFLVTVDDLPNLFVATTVMVLLPSF